MELSERAIETSGAFADAEREREIRRSQAQLDREGCGECEDCGEDIPAKRRKALPSARRCVGCQQAHERRVR